MNLSREIVFPYVAAAWAAVLILGVTILVGQELGAQGLPFQVGGGLIAALAGALVWMAVSEPLRLRKAVAEATEAVAQSEARYRLLYEQAPLAYFTLDDHANIKRANQRAAEVLGTSVDALEGQQLLDLFADDPEGRQRVEAAIDAFLEGKEMPATEAAMVGPEGERLWVQLAIREVGGRAQDGEHSLSMVMDITSRKHAEDQLTQFAEELERSNEDLEQFAYVVSHDLQEPLRMVRSYVGLLERRYGEELDQDAKEFIEYAVDGVDRMEGLIKALLSYSRVGTRGNDPVPVDLGEVLTEVTDDLQVAIEEARATIDHDGLPTVMADPDQARQLLSNLVGNAIKYRSEEPPKIWIRAQREGKRWRIEVQDNGQGLPDGFEDRAFDIFQRGVGRDEDIEGTGIGLAICKRIVERHDGSIGVDSQPGKGSTFWFTLPAEEAGRGSPATGAPMSERT